MFENISLMTYGRCVKRKGWWIQDSIGINRIYYIHSGNVLFRSGMIEKMLEAGKSYLFPQNLQFELVTDEHTCVDHTFIDFTTVPPIKMDDVVELTACQDSLNNSAWRVLMEIIEAYPMFPDYQRNKFYNTTKAYLRGLLEIMDETAGLGTIDEPIISETLNYIHRNFHNDISITDLAEKFNYHVNFFIKKFKKYMNMTPYQYIVRYRLNTAINLLRQNTYTVSEVAELVGYSSVSSFSHTFKKLYGIYPSELSDDFELV